MKKVACAILLLLSVSACSDDTAGGSPDSSQSASVSSSASSSIGVIVTGPLQTVLVEDFNSGVPPENWTKLGMYSHSGDGYSCTTNGTDDGGYCAKFGGGTQYNTNWIETPDISSYGATAVSFYYRTGLDYDKGVLNFQVLASQDQINYTPVAELDNATAVFQKAGPFALPAGTKYVRFSHVKILNWNVFIDAVVFGK